MVINAVKIGWVLTFLWIIIIVYLLIEKPLPSSLNEMGDFIAGISSPLAFLWVVVSYYQSQQALVLQAEELSQNTKVLAAQVEEMKRTTEIQEDQLMEMKQQYAELGIQERIKRQPFFDIKFVRLIEEISNNQYFINIRFDIECMSGFARTLSLSFDGIDSESDHINYIKEGEIKKIMIRMDVRSLRELNNKALEIIYYDKNHTLTKQKYRYFHNEIDQNELSFEKFIIS
ncbi:hypothetical protein B9X71_13200 [Acinetobacter baumannii]|uniref:hypothetical protein n=1 Tax=Acinetobacter baumannii TaxID=470 RepID=UPI000A337219|nr:hypothetical protein [Acinetobacter baumannii]MCT9166405.1 hypothetical protein [Acinetobacter baumannii]MCT9173638.1 hypothetical protein [Acinetobacter baumannii]MCT9180923.1 hypothetical protein [Acinetobacter baumannii]OTK45914.1 hypothetical protein B9X71_13200 [Acinetobacter baumannii]